MESRLKAGDTLIVGCGYIGTRVAECLQAQALVLPQTVYTMTRSVERADELSKKGFFPIVADWTDRRTLQKLPVVKKVLVAVSYDPKSPYSREVSQVGGLSNLLDLIDSDADICYLSTTGVYHQNDGGWVDESSPTRPVGAGGLAHLRGESLLHRRRPIGKWVILRLAGIYGPKRIPRVENIVRGRPIDGSGSGFLNLIHRDDAARAVIASWSIPEQRERCYVVSDDNPVVRSSFYGEVSRLTGAPPPTFLSKEKTAFGARSNSNKRVWNRRMRRDLVNKLCFPSYREGLPDLLAQLW